MLRVNIEIDGDKTEFNILENDYDTGITENYNSQSNVNDVGSLSEPLEERSAESVIIFDGTKGGASNSTAQISNVIYSDVLYEGYDTMTTAIEDGMYSSAEVGGKDLVGGEPSGDYNPRCFVSGIWWNNEMKHLASSLQMSGALFSTYKAIEAGAEVWAYRLVNRVESKVYNKSISVVVDGYEV